MEKSIKVIIGGREFRLYGDDEELIQRAAEEVNTKIKDIESTQSHLPANTVSILSALNLAEEKLKTEKDKEAKLDKLESELKKMCDFLETRLSQAVNAT